MYDVSSNTTFKLLSFFTFMFAFFVFKYFLIIFANNVKLKFRQPVLFTSRQWLAICQTIVEVGSMYAWLLRYRDVSIFSRWRLTAILDLGLRGFGPSTNTTWWSLSLWIIRFQWMQMLWYCERFTILCVCLENAYSRPKKIGVLGGFLAPKLGVVATRLQWLRNHVVWVISCC